MSTNGTGSPTIIDDVSPGLVRIHVPGPVSFVSLSSPAEFGFRRILMGLILLLIVTGGAGYSGWCVWLQLQSQGWSQVPAVVRFAGVDEQSTIFPPGGRVVRPRPGGRVQTTTVNVRYRYQFRGGEFESDAIDRPLNLNVSGSYARHHAQKHTANATVMAYVNPAQPREAVLQTRVLAEHLAVMVVVLPLLPCGLLLVKTGVVQTLDRVWKRSLVCELIVDDGVRVCIWLPCRGAFRQVMIVWAVLLALFAGILLAVLLLMYVEISAWWVVLTLITATGLAIASGFRRRNFDRSPTRAIVIDRSSRSIHLPAIADSRSESVLSIDDVRIIEASDVLKDVVHSVGRLLPETGSIRNATQLCLITHDRRFTLVIRQEVELLDRMGERLASILSQIKR